MQSRRLCQSFSAKIQKLSLEFLKDLKGLVLSKNLCSLKMLLGTRRDKIWRTLGKSFSNNTKTLLKVQKNWKTRIYNLSKNKILPQIVALAGRRQFWKPCRKFGPQVKETHSKYENDGRRNSFGKKSSMKCSLGKRRLRFLGPLNFIPPKSFYCSKYEKFNEKNLSSRRHFRQIVVLLNT